MLSPIIRKLLALVVAIGLALPARAQYPDYQFWTLVDSADIPADEIDTAFMHRTIRYLEQVLDDYTLRYVYYLELNPNREGLTSRTVNFQWPVNPDSSFNRPFYSCNNSYRIETNTDGGIDTLSYGFSGNASVEPGVFGVFSGYYSPSVPMEWVSNGAPMHYYARSFKPGLRPRYGFFLQEVHPVWHPPLVGTDESVRPLTGVYPNPWRSGTPLTIIWPSGTGPAASAHLYASDGRITWSSPALRGSAGTEITLDVDDTVPPGTYTLVFVPVLERPFVTQVVRLE